ncbi:MAG TPA: ACT domain-containing protein [Verrucomicrobiae bacterium]|nr:ACT domain-containing protein [Verrucomicrobiae bacterium]
MAGRPHAQVARQLAVFLDNRPGTLASLCGILSEAKINIFAISTSDTIDHSVVRLVLSDPHTALERFEEHGLLVVENDVIMLDGANRPGSLERIAKKLADHRVNIEYAYCATSPTSKRGLMVMRTDNLARAMRALNSMET